MLFAPSSRDERIKHIADAFLPLMWFATRQFGQKLAAFGLTPPQFMALAALARHLQPCTMSDLTAVSLQDPPTMTGIIDRLVAMKLVQRTRSDTDRRVVWVQATPAGTNLIEQIMEKSHRDGLTNYAALSDAELAAIEQLVESLLRIHVSQLASTKGTDVEAQVERLRLFMNDPIAYVKSEHN
jgi:DNA-binding MarR family transcriptional regulator